MWLLCHVFTYISTSVTSNIDPNLRIFPLHLTKKTWPIKAYSHSSYKIYNLDQGPWFRYRPRSVSADWTEQHDKNCPQRSMKWNIMTSRPSAVTNLRKQLFLFQFTFSGLVTGLMTWLVKEKLATETECVRTSGQRSMQLFSTSSPKQTVCCEWMMQIKSGNVKLYCDQKNVHFNLLCLIYSHE